MGQITHGYKPSFMLFVGLVAILCCRSANGFIPQPPRALLSSPVKPHNVPPGCDFSARASLVNISTDDQALAFWITAFSVSHIGMSAVRDKIIDACGQLAARMNLVDREIIALPSYWPGDDVGKNEIFPDADTAGRQIYRALYTLISFATLFGGAFSAYLASVATTTGTVLTDDSFAFCFAVAVIAQGVSIASLFNASPLSLVPGFEQEDDGLLFKRNDSLKFRPYGLTRITRHPLILPVVPWGIANSFLAGGRLSDFLLFGGLALYAVAGCAAQDLRVIREEGSVGTVFRPDSELQDFFAATSFVPFQAVVDGRQSMQDAVKEVPWIAFLGGSLVGALIEDTLLKWLKT